MEKSVKTCKNLQQGGIKMEIQRDFYLDKLLYKRGNGFVKIITGLRRCGKSYLLRKIFKKRLLAEGLPESQIIE